MIERTLLFNQPVWLTVWSKELSTRVTSGPHEAIGVELNCDTMDINCIIVKGASHTHHRPQNVFSTEEEADINTRKEIERDVRRKELRDRLEQSGASRGGVFVEAAHNPGESSYRRINTAKQDDVEQGY